ncbi:MAG: response regulator [Thermodesulfobacteria bacterium]|nr:response regulator [Thermodesulfobacteriota bacterium]
MAESAMHDFKPILGEEQVELLVAQDGQELVDLAKEYHPDLIILERNIPVLDGLSALLLLKNDERTKEIPIVAVCEGRCDQEEQAKDAGCDAHLTRPLNPAKIREVLKNFLRGGRT